MPNSREGLIYEMSIDARRDLAMILPIPVAAGSGEDAVEFLNFEKYADVFSDLRSLYPAPLPSMAFSRAGGAPKAAALAVQNVGAFAASFVPTVKDFSRLDAQFRLPDGVWEDLGQYSKYGFAVFKLRQGRADFHPMAFTFPTAMPGRIFFPTVHIHDGKVHRTAEFDHTLYTQFGGTSPDPHKWEESPATADSEVRIRSTHGLISARHHVHRMSLRGRFKNADVIV